MGDSKKKKFNENITSILIDKELHRKLKIAAAIEGKTLGSFIEGILNEALKRINLDFLNK